MTTFDRFAGYHETHVHLTEDITVFTYIGGPDDIEHHVKCSEGDGLGGFAILSQGERV